jgi:flagellar basal-body rod protein FlgC
MTTDAIFAVTRQGLDFERGRMEAASRRIATANLPVAARREALNSAGATGFASSLASEPADGGTHNVQDPQSPLAGADGMVAYPDTDLAQEMSTLMSAQRGYQADIRAFNALHGMLLKALTIGGR